MFIQLLVNTIRISFQCLRCSGVVQCRRISRISLNTVICVDGLFPSFSRNPRGVPLSSDAYDISQLLQVLKGKTILNFYSNYLERFRYRPNSLSFLAGRSGHYQEENLQSFVDRQLVLQRQQVTHLEEVIRQYFTVMTKIRTNFVVSVLCGILSISLYLS